MRAKTTVRNIKPNDVNHHFIVAINRQKHAATISAHASGER